MNQIPRHLFSFWVKLFVRVLSCREHLWPEVCLSGSMGLHRGLPCLRQKLLRDEIAASLFLNKIFSFGMLRSETSCILTISAECSVWKTVPRISVKKRQSNISKSWSWAVPELVFYGGTFWREATSSLTATLFDFYISVSTLKPVRFSLLVFFSSSHEIVELWL